MVEVDYEGDLQEFQDDLREFEQVDGLPQDDNDDKTDVSGQLQIFIRIK